MNISFTFGFSAILGLLTLLLYMWKEWKDVKEKERLLGIQIYVDLLGLLAEGATRATIVFILSLLSTMLAVPWPIYGLLIALAILLGIA